jgi:hypothetical protein
MKRKPTRMAPRKRSAGSELLRGSRRQRSNTARMPTQDSASSAKTSHAPTAATRTPAIAGPMAREMLMPMLFSAMAEGNSSADTSSGTIADHAGIVRAVPIPMAKMKLSSSQAIIMPSAVSAASAPSTIRKYTLTAIRSLRRSTMSAIAPAGNASSITGSVVAAATSATIDGEDASEVINQPAPTSFIQVPMFETSVAIHRARNSPWRSGLQGDCGLRYGS